MNITNTRRRACSFFLLWIVFFCNFTETAAAETHSRVKRVVHGYLPESGILPWMASINNGRNRKENKGNASCSGALIYDQWLMTARHCVVNSKGHLIPTKKIKYSIFGLDGNNHPSRHALEVHVYSSYSENPVIDGLTDFALIKTKEKHDNVDKLALNLEFFPDDKIRMLNSLPMGNRMHFYIAGWGYTSFRGNQLTSNLHWGITPLQDGIQLNEHFAKLHSLFHDHHFDSKSYLLAGRYDGNFSDDCSGDSGGPLWLANSTSSANATAIGIAIGGVDSCGKAGDLGIYLRLSVVKDFINSTIAVNNE